MRLENSIENIYRDLIIYKNLDYIELYKDSFQSENLVKTFSTLHNLLIINFKKMNERLPTKNNTAHFWAEESRELILAIDSIKTLERRLKNSKYAFELDDYCRKILNITYQFLASSGGSEIPIGMNKIELYYKLPIFKPTKSIEVYNEIKSSPLKMIGEGSYAHVYKYKDPYYGSYIVVKKAKKDLNKKEIERFKREYKVMKSLSSPYIVKVYCYNDKEKKYYMEFMDYTLDKYIEENNSKLTIEQKKGISLQILRAFKYINSQKILHRDISPRNILIKRYDHVDVVKIADFGLVKTTNSHLTSIDTEFKGYFNDPELEIKGFKNYSTVHETYALTRIIAYVMTGKLNINKIRDEELKKFIEKGISTDKRERYKTIDDLIYEFKKLI